MTGKVELTNQNGTKVTIDPIGSRIVSVIFLTPHGRVELIVTPKIVDLSVDPFYLGATCGPVCNRIANAQFTISGVKYHVSKNDGNNCLHGGANNIAIKKWDVVTSYKNSVSLKLEVAHLEDGFPGNREFIVTYKLEENDTIDIDMVVNSDRKTPINLTNHTYFNLGEDDISNLSFKLESDKFLEKRDDGIPTGKFIKTNDVQWYLQSWSSIGAFINENTYKQIQKDRGIDHCFVVTPNSHKQAELYSKKNNIKLTLSSNQPSIQVYTGHFLSSPYIKEQGVCFEPQQLTDALNQPLFDFIYTGPENSYQNRIQYRFENV